jgi:hypothetical protein
MDDASLSFKINIISWCGVLNDGTRQFPVFSSKVLRAHKRQQIIHRQDKDIQNYNGDPATTTVTTRPLCD